MKVIVNYSNRLTLLKGKINSGFIKWALLGFSNHHRNPEILNLTPSAQIRVIGEEKNTFAFIKFPKLNTRESIEFNCNLSFKTINLKIPLINFNFNEYSTEMINKYCTYSKFWPIHNEEIQEIAKKLKLESQDNVKKYLELTYNYVRDVIKLREDMNERLGALRILEEKIGDCDEFSDLFITLLRASNIPARRVVGLFIATNKQEHQFHAWSEVYIPHYMAFIPFDVALDFFSCISQNHIVRLKMAKSEHPQIVYAKYKGTPDVKLKSIENDLKGIEIIEN